MESVEDTQGRVVQSVATSEPSTGFTGKKNGEDKTFTFQGTSALFVLKIVILMQILPASIHSSSKWAQKWFSVVW